MLTVSQQALIKACKKLNIPYKLIHSDRFVVRVDLQKALYFYHHYKPFNTTDIAYISKDKDLSYEILHKNINIPKWKAYLAPNCNPKYQHLDEFSKNSQIAEDIIKRFQMPVIVKMNKGSMGKNVFKCQNTNDLLDALDTIFDRDSVEYDYIALAQQHINIKKEYRVIAWRGKVLLVYAKDNSKAAFEGNLSPLHWKNAKAVWIKDKAIIKKFEAFIQPIFKTIPTQFFGADIAIDNSGEKYLLEINNAPGVAKFVQDNSLQPIEDMYVTILKDLKE